MAPPAPSTPAEWREFLRTYSTEFLGSDFLRTADAEDRGQWIVSDLQREAGWLGHEPATEEAISAAEERLGVRLPPTYRNLLRVTDGFSTLAYSLDLIPVEEIGWFPELEPELLGAWSSPGLEFFAEHLRVLVRCLVVSNDDGGAGGYWLLHAEEVAADGEWTAYEWWPGDGGEPEPYADFAALVTSVWNAHS